MDDEGGHHPLMLKLGRAQNWTLIGGVVKCPGPTHQEADANVVIMLFNPLKLLGILSCPQVYLLITGKQKSQISVKYLFFRMVP